MPIQDASYFCNGYGMAGQVGDTIRLAGTAQTARVIGINYNTNTLTLSQALSWSAGQGVALDYTGSAPDLGVFEYDAGLLLGDLDCDGSVNMCDVNPFVQYLTNFVAWQADFPGCDPASGDINGDGACPDFGDINPFVQLLCGI